MRLIDADELKKECRSVPDPKGRYAELRIIEDYEIDDAPTIFEISDNATNGDVIKMIFKPNRVERTKDNVIVEEYMFDKDWWNSSYK